MSRFVTKVGDKYIEEIESMEVCKWKINEVCCNEECILLGYYVESYVCEDGECDCFEEEDGIIDE